MKLLTYLFTLSVLLLFLNSCSSNAQKSAGTRAMEQFSITTEPTNKIYPGKVVWHDLLTSDIHKAAEFYQKLFGWQAEFHGPYAVMSFNGKPVAGILEIQSTQGKLIDGIWIPSFSVTEVDQAARQAEANGARILTKPVTMKQRGRAALIRDPNNADLVLLRAKSGDPEDHKAAHGEWLWDEIWTSKPQQTRDFYQKVMQYDAMINSEQYDVLLSKDKWRAGVRHLEDDSQPMIWVPVIRVADPQALADQVEDAGGIVWMDPSEKPDNPDTALISDTTGALLLIQRWPVESEGGEQ